jgi:type I site-specific restriction endonuclease
VRPGRPRLPGNYSLRRQVRRILGLVDRRALWQRAAIAFGRAVSP